MKWIVDLLRAPAVENINVDASDRLTIHRAMLASKQMLREVFYEFHRDFDTLDKKFFTGSGERVELGAGVCPVRDSFPDVLATDVMPAEWLDRQLDAENMDLQDETVRAFFCQNSFHHFPHPELFFKDLERVLVRGGGVVLIEPYHGPLAAFLFKRMFRTEGYDKEFPTWDTPAFGPMNGANQALSYIVFIRDRSEFERKFPALKVIYVKPCGNYLKYLLSGGLNFRQLCPDWASPVIDRLQSLLCPLSRWIALHHIVVIRKEEA